MPSMQGANWALEASVRQFQDVLDDVYRTDALLGLTPQQAVRVVSDVLQRALRGKRGFGNVFVVYHVVWASATGTLRFVVHRGGKAFGRVIEAWGVRLDAEHRIAALHGIRVAGDVPAWTFTWT